jgi:HD domain
VTNTQGTSMQPRSSATDVVAGVHVPNTPVAAEATEHVRAITSDVVYQHSRRVYFFGSLQGRNRRLSFDPELLYVAALFHDVGLSAYFGASGRRFEIDSADEARTFLSARGVPEGSIRRVWTAVALHTTPGIPEHMEPEVALLTAGVELDVLGLGYHDIPADARAEITAAHPRPHFKREILQAFTDGMVDRPETTVGTVNADVLERFVPGFQRGDFVDTIENSPWPE